jgi:hypothetical protein
MTSVRFCGPGGRDATGYGRQDAYHYRSVAVPKRARRKATRFFLLPDGPATPVYPLIPKSQPPIPERFGSK